MSTILKKETAELFPKVDPHNLVTTSSRALSECGYTPLAAPQDDHWSRTNIKKKLSFTNTNTHTDNINIHSCRKVNVPCNMQNALRKAWGFQNIEV